MTIRTAAAVAALSINLFAQKAEMQTSADQSLRILQEGNERYVAARLSHPNQNAARRTEVAAGQHPIAAVLSCADSRVPPELIFDRGLGDLFVVRVAGNIADDAILGSLEYAAEHLHVPLIVVLGHQKCGAVSAAVAGGRTKTHIDSLIDAINPAVAAVKGKSGDVLDNAVRANVLRVTEQLKSDPSILAGEVREGKLKIVGGVYSLETGKITLLVP